MGDLGVQVSVHSSVNIYPGCLVSASPLTVLYWSFWNFACVFFMVWGCACGLDIIVRLLVVTFSTLWTCHFFTSMCRQWVPCERNSSYNFIPIFLKPCTCFLHDPKMCMWFGYNPCINFYHFFHIADFVISWPQILWKCTDSGYLVSANFIPIFLKLCTCFCHGLEMSVWFEYNPAVNFFHFVNFVIFWPQILWKCIDSEYHLSATPYTTSSLSLFNFAHLFVHGLKMCMWFGFNPAVNFCHFSTLLTSSFFAGATSTSPKFDLYFFFKSHLSNLPFLMPHLLGDSWTFWNIVGSAVIT